MSRWISAIGLPELRANATVSAFNSLVNLRLECLSVWADSNGASIPRFQVSLEAGQVHGAVPPGGRLLWGSEVRSE
jgi:hypothetical protein